MRDDKSIGRPREFDESEVLTKIMQVFWENGYEGTSLSDLMAATGLNKGSLYAAFGDKRAMYLKGLAHYEAEVVDTAVTYLADSHDVAPDVRIREFLSAPIRAVWSEQDTRGCFLCNASADHAALDEETARLVKRGFDKLANALTVAVQQLGFSKKDARQKSHLLVTVYSGLRVMARSGYSKTMLEAARNTALECLAASA